MAEEHVQEHVHEHVQDLLPGYALGCLDVQDLLLVARHLPRCAVCRAELDSYWATAEQLVLSAPAMLPPPQLKQKILAQCERRTGRVEPYTDRIDPPANRNKPTGSARASWLATLFGPVRSGAVAWRTAVALLLVVVLGVSNLLLWGQVNRLQARLPGENVQIVRLLGTPDAPNAQGYLLVFENESYGTLVVEDAPALALEFQYQLWLIRDGQRISGGVFSVNEHGYGTLQIDASQPLQSFPSFGITVEPFGGSPGPTGHKVLGGDL
jgi:anti-sigma-K factor RskA